MVSIYTQYYICYSLFGLIIIGSSFNMPCISRNFFMILTGGGKGLFNIFVGLLLYITAGYENNYIFDLLVGILLVSSGIFFLFLSKCSNMSDDQLQRATSINADNLRKQAAKGAINVAKNNKDAIKKAAYDNKEVIAQVAYDNRDVIA